MTTADAHELLIAADVGWRKRKGLVDQIAALPADEQQRLSEMLADELAAREAHPSIRKRLVAFEDAFEGKRLQKLDIGSKDQADGIVAMLEGATYRVVSVEAKPTKRNPGPPFTTSTLQQAASSNMGFAAARTMQIAQRLYEGVDIGGETAGLITYMRTDGVQMAREATLSIRDHVGQAFGKQYVPPAPREYSTKAKNAQEAHEAIRPADPSRRPQDVARWLDGDLARLYELIWKRSMACQMEAAEFERTTAEIAGGEVTRSLARRPIPSLY